MRHSCPTAGACAFYRLTFQHVPGLVMNANTDLMFLHRANMLIRAMGNTLGNTIIHGRRIFLVYFSPAHYHEQSPVQFSHSMYDHPLLLVGLTPSC